MKTLYLVELKSERLKGKILVTGYENPDLDGTACIIAYSELLQKQGFNATSGIIGKIHRETLFLFENFGIEKPEFNEDEIKNFDKVILVDASTKSELSEKIDFDKVVEIVDHRKSNEANLFKKAKIQIELVGAAATLITEKFTESRIKPTRNSSILLYGAIISNTLNFKSNTTTERDVEAAKWLKERVNLPEDFTRKMFLAKSDFKNRNLKEILIQDHKVVVRGKNNKICIFQLEVVNLEKIITERKGEIFEFLKESKGDFNYIFLTAIDLEKGFNIFVVVDDDTKNLLEKILGVKFIGNIAKREGVLMRKEIIPIIEKYL